MPEFDMGVAGLVAGYVALAIILMSLHVYSAWSPPIKAAVTALMIAFCFVSYRSYPALLGWPVATDQLPSRLFLIGLETVEPDSIYLWARDMDAGLGYRRPRAYDLPYSKSLHEEAAKAGQKLRRGLKVVVEIDQAGDRVLTRGDEGAALEDMTIRFIVAPEGLLPAKD